jgi:hypothetical protein
LETGQQTIPRNAMHKVCIVEMVCGVIEATSNVGIMQRRIVVSNCHYKAVGQESCARALVGGSETLPRFPG